MFYIIPIIFIYVFYYLLLFLCGVVDSDVIDIDFIYFDKDINECLLIIWINEHDRILLVYIKGKQIDGWNVWDFCFYNEDIEGFNGFICGICDFIDYFTDFFSYFYSYLDF